LQSGKKKHFQTVTLLKCPNKFSEQWWRRSFETEVTEERRNLRCTLRWLLLRGFPTSWWKQPEWSQKGDYIIF